MAQQYATPRRNGKSTRLVDKYIQDLFTFGEVEVRDHLDIPTQHDLLVERVLDRLSREHKFLMPFLFRDKTKLTIVLGRDLHISPVDDVHEDPRIKNEIPKDVTTT